MTRAKGERTEEEWKEVKRIDYSPLLRSHIAAPNSVTFFPTEIVLERVGGELPLRNNSAK